MLNRIRRLLGRPEFRRVPEVRFLGEQDGEPERELKARLSAVLEPRPLVDRAYLAQVAYAGAQGVTVALCILGPEAPDLAAAIGREFAKRAFGYRLHFDGAGRDTRTGVQALLRPAGAPDGTMSYNVAITPGVPSRAAAG